MLYTIFPDIFIEIDYLERLEIGGEEDVLTDGKNCVTKGLDKIC